jgi:hypothetical protein
MKKLLIITATLIAMIQNISATENNLKMCKTFIKQGTAYQSTLKNQTVNNATLTFYKNNVVSHCGSIIARVQYEKEFFPQFVVKNIISSIQGCKTSIKIAKHYKDSASNKEILNAYKENIVDNCGTLVAKTQASFCLFSAVDTSKQETIKAHCLSAIKEAHTVKNINSKDKTLALHKSNIVDKCGKLQASL